MMKNHLLLLPLLFVLALNISAQPPAEVQNVLNKINPSAIKAHMAFLSDDLLEGRQPGTRGFLLASKYMETQFISLGLKPGVNETSYIQRVPLAKASVNDVESEFILIDQNNKQEKLEYTKQYSLAPYFDSPESNVTASLVFVGYGISAPDFGYDAYNGVDVKGKIVVYLNGSPAGIPNDPKAFYGGAAQKYSEAIKRGAVGVISFTRPTNTTPRNSGEGRTRRPRPASYKWESEQMVVGNSFGELKAIASLTSEGAQKLFVNSVVPLQKVFDMATEGRSASFPLNISASIKVSTKIKCLTHTCKSEFPDRLPGSQ